MHALAALTLGDVRRRRIYPSRVSDKDRGPWLDAYRDAWSIRLATGDDGADVLLDQLKAQDVELGDDEAFQGILLKWWERGVPPERLPLAALREVPRLLGKIGRAYWEVFKAFR